MESKDKLSALKNDFDLWRSERKKGTPVPDNLKKNACSLLNDHDIYHIARSCSVSKNLIETWNKNLKNTAEKTAATIPLAQQRRHTDPTTFIFTNSRYAC